MLERSAARASGRVATVVGAALIAALSLACASRFPHIGERYVFFAAPRADDPFVPKIEDWQQRASGEREESLADLLEEPSDPESQPFGGLYAKLDRFLIQHKRSLARDFTAWAQRQARLHFKPDPQTTLSGDHWPTLREFFENNGDDCDGLDLIAYGLLRRAGFRADETYRMIVRRESDGANHMVTLWFEDRNDPWVLDATGAMSVEMKHFSEMPPGWLPRMMFNETEMYEVVDRGSGRYELARDHATGAGPTR